ncbi:MAG: hypothetical protein ACJAZS_000001, partial [Alteromonas naphthalenivorans]
MEKQMKKKLLLAFSLFSTIGLHGAAVPAADTMQPYNLVSQASLGFLAGSFSAADILNHDSAIKLKSKDGKIVTLPFSTNNPDDNIFETINSLIEDLGIDDTNPIPIPMKKENIEHAISLYTDPNYQL